MTRRALGKGLFSETGSLCVALAVLELTVTEIYLPPRVEIRGVCYHA